LQTFFIFHRRVIVYLPINVDKSLDFAYFNSRIPF